MSIKKTCFRWLTTTNAPLKIIIAVCFLKVIIIFLQRKNRLKNEKTNEFNQSISFDSYMKETRSATKLDSSRINTNTVPSSQSPPSVAPTPSVSAVSTSSTLSTRSLTTAISLQASPIPLTNSSTSAPLANELKYQLAHVTIPETGSESHRLPSAPPQLRRANKPKPQRSSSLNLQQVPRHPEEHVPKRNSGDGRLEGDARKPSGGETNHTSRGSSSVIKRGNSASQSQISAKHEREVFIASCSLNPLYTSSLEYICTPLSFNRAQQTAADAKADSKEPIQGPSSEDSPKNKKLQSGTHSRSKSKPLVDQNDSNRPSSEKEKIKSNSAEAGLAESVETTKTNASTVEKELPACRPSVHNLQSERPARHKLHKMYTSASLSHFEKPSANPKIYKRSSSSESAQIKHITPSPLEGRI